MNNVSEVLEEHKHIWGPEGCWCGAKRCRQDRTPAPTPENMHPRQRYCQNAALKSANFCQEHISGRGGAA
jgi:hypothetical protein